MRLNLYRVIGFLTIVLLGGLPAYADDIHLCPFNPNTCNANGVIPISSSQTTADVFGPFPIGGLYLAELVPVAGNSGNFNSTTTFWAALGLTLVSPPPTFPTLASAISQEFGATGLTANSFNVTDMFVGAWTMDGQAVSLPANSTGTIFMAFTIRGPGVAAVTSFSSSLVDTGTGTTSVPEPSTGLLSLLGVVGLAGLAFLRKL